MAYNMHIIMIIICFIGPQGKTDSCHSHPLQHKTKRRFLNTDFEASKKQDIASKGR